MDSLPRAILERIASHLENHDLHRDRDDPSSVVALSLANRKCAEVGRSLVFRSVYLSGEDDAEGDYFASHIAPQRGALIRELFCNFGVDSLDEEEAELDDEELLAWSTFRRGVLARALPHLVDLEILALDIGDGNPPMPPEDDPLLVAADHLRLQSLRLLPLHLSDPHPSIDPSYLGEVLPSFSSLTSLDITAVGNYGADSNASFVEALQGLPNLTSLALRDCDALGPPITHLDWTCPLTSLTLHRITRLDLIDLEEFLSHFRTTLTSLNLHHYSTMDDATHALFELPLLVDLELETVWPVWHLATFGASKGIKRLKLGSALSPWKDEDGEGEGWNSALLQWQDLQSFTLMRGERCWGRNTVLLREGWCEDRGIAFAIEEEAEDSDSEATETESEEWDSEDPF
ncbi:hypothetical protein BCR35DRAFT_331589 [Leucosporidium creatinivorum]|uniref:F-box domain-containing protein n=1 Tax=Leucosporidium creatinivorum TaxID=106004 RepID=A0A1Y2FG84_9BASI|nr:hypothetical protein BCR35DRAFT_331589 [Leucosporidium creatinivorum]